MVKGGHVLGKQPAQSHGLVFSSAVTIYCLQVHPLCACPLGVLLWRAPAAQTCHWFPLRCALPLQRNNLQERALQQCTLLTVHLCLYLSCTLLNLHHSTPPAAGLVGSGSMAAYYSTPDWGMTRMLQRVMDTQGYDRTTAPHSRELEQLYRMVRPQVQVGRLCCWLLVRPEAFLLRAGLRHSCAQEVSWSIYVMW